MNRQVITIAAALFLAAGWAYCDEKPGEKPGAKRPGAKGKFDGKGKGEMGDLIFKRLDANGDGKISKEEFKKMGEMRPGGKGEGRPELGEKMFDRLDANGDGFVSVEEFKKLREQFQNRGGPAGKKPGERPPIKPPENK